MSARPHAAWLAAVAAIVPMAALAVPSAAQAPAGPFVAPDRPMVLTRMLRRPLPDGKEVIGLRTYLLRFTRQGGRIRVDGQLLAVTVDAPPALKGMIEIERNRPDTGMFPMWLDDNGMLLPENSRPVTAAVTASIGHVLARIDALQAQDKESAEALASQIRNRGGQTPWPRDLFNPAPGARKDARKIPLPNGQSGAVTIDVEATAANGMLDSFTRKVTTDLDGDRRVTVEEWKLAEAPE